MSLRTQCVKVNGCFSDLLPVMSGVPQGSILGPLLFVLYNDLPDALSSVIPYLFADDTKCLHVSSPQSDQIDPPTRYYYRSTSMHYTLTVTHGICSSMKLNVYIFISTSILVLVFLHTISTTTTYVEKTKQKI